MTGLLRRGLQKELVRRVLSPVGATRKVASLARPMLPGQGPGRSESSNRTDVFAHLLDEVVFAGARLDLPTRDGLAVVLTSTDLATGSAVRFGSQRSSCSRFGRILDPVTVGTAVAASAAYPILLPTLDRTFRFERRDGQVVQQRVTLTDGGIFDNLGLSVMQPGRSTAYTDHVYDVTHVLSCDAGRGPLAHSFPGNWFMRNARAFQVLHAQAQNQARGRLHEWHSAGGIDGFVMAYLGQRDRLLPRPLADLVPNERTASYGTNFAEMPADDFAAITTRGEQLMRLLLPHYCPELLA